ncbi:MAG: hypothetical protein HSCHL_2661 [Hydrogenibacillus schlegelii]|uniref:Uncharacterized protein n=1 Tax=Hydrogenibacillus schlegelii TaxID=1484 RepID=A0A2T5G3K2_HYDSH|nr:MAG: hypothetical protein HSCHL_2661 [Hydrogenibacillus schlegelii]
MRYWTDDVRAVFEKLRTASIHLEAFQRQVEKDSRQYSFAAE